MRSHLRSGSAASRMAPSAYARGCFMTCIGSSPISCVIVTRLMPFLASLGSRGGTEWLRTFDPFAFTGTVHRLPQINAPLNIEPEVGAVAEHARQDQGGRRRHGPAVVA